MPSPNDLTTPALLLDKSILLKNLERMQAIADRLGVALRPHLKTAKSIEVARLALALGAKGITVSTLKEAEYFAAHGVTDIFYAVSVIGRHVPRMAALVRRGAALSAGIDSVEAARQVVEAAQAEAVSLALRIEVDSGEARGGVTAESAELLEIARLLRAGGQRLAGVFTHAGHSYGCADEAARRMLARREQAAARLAAERLEAAEFPVSVASWGSTPTAVHAEPAAGFTGVTELRCGVYILGDLFQAGIGSHAVRDIAVSVLATVIRQRPEQNRLIIDAGAFALSKDRSTAALGAEGDAGFGLIANEAGEVVAPRLIVAQAYQEHGIVVSPSGAPINFAQFPVGSRVRVLPNHACTTAAAYDRYHVIENGRVIAEWDRVNGW